MRQSPLDLTAPRSPAVSWPNRWRCPVLASTVR